MLDSISEKAFLADGSHVHERASDTAREEILAQAGEGGSIRATEHIRRDREIELVDQILLEECAEKCGPSFAGYRSNPVLASELFQHPGEID